MSWRTVFLKECRENLRDRRSVLNALVWGPLLMPAMFLGQMAAMAQQAKEGWEAPALAVAGAEYAPNLVAFLKGEGVQVQPSAGNPQREVREQRENAVLVIADTYPEAWRSGRPAPVELVYDASRRKSDLRARRIRGLLDQYSHTAGSLRLLVRGLDPAVAQPLAVQDRDVSEGGAGGAVIASFLPFVLMFSAFLGGFYLAVDTTAGERERQSLEPLLANPTSRLELVLGKLAATVAFSAAATAVGIVAFAVCLLAAMRWASLDALGLDLSVAWDRWLLLAGLLLPVTLLASALQTLVAAFSRSFREAQTWVQFLMFVPMVPCFVVMFNPVRPELRDMLIPFWGQTVLIDRVLRGEALDAVQVLVAGGATAALAALVVGVIVALYKGERLLFGAA